MKKYFSLASLFFVLVAGAQVGIGTSTPKALLDIPATSSVTPSNSDGILIPRINAFPLTNPTIDQNGMMVFLATDLPGKPTGFYYWDHPTTTWKGIGGATSDADFYEVGTATPPDAITDAMFHSGNVGIGNVNPTYKLDIDETASAKTYALRAKHSNAIDGGTTSSIRSEIAGSFATGTVQGISNSVVPGAGTTGTGLHNLMQGTSSGEVFGVNNNIQTIGTGQRIAVNNSVSGAGTGLTFGTQNTFSNASASSYFGTCTTMASAGVGNKIGVRNRILNSTGGFHTGVNNTFTDNDGALEETGVFSQFTGSSVGNIRGAYNEISNSGNGVHYGLYNNINGSGGVQRYGVQNILSGNSGGIQYGVENSISATGDNTHYGTQNYLNGTGTGSHFGTRNWLASSGSGEQTGSENLIDNTGIGIHKGTSNKLSGTSNGEQYGTYNYITNTGSGTKYGSYNKIFSTAGPEIHYGVYSEVPKTIGYAGYFLGRVSIGTTAANSYLLPTFRGTSGQVITTDNFGNTAWNNVNTIAWGLNGNNAGPFNFIGTINDADVKFQRGNIVAGKLAVNNTAFGVGTLSNPAGAPVNQGIDNVAVGYQALKENWYGNDCVAVGKGALQNNSFYDGNTALGSEAMFNNDAPFNTAVGREALYSNVRSLGMTAIGYRSMYYQGFPSSGAVYGIYHTAMGYESLMGSPVAAENTGTGNSAVGYFAGRLMSSGSYNVAMGWAALSGNGSGNDNVALGRNAAAWNVAGSGCVAVGNGALLYANNTTTNFISYNTAIGYYALRGSVTAANNTGTLNTAVGGQSLLLNTSGTQNAGFGVNALYSNSTGSFNTGVGVGALFNNSTGSGNVAIGNSAGSSETGSNKLYIDNSGTANPLIYGDFSSDLLRANGNVRIKSTTVAGSGEMQIKNSNLFNHLEDNNLNFGTGTGYFMMSTTDANSGNETGGIRGDGDNIAIWSPGDGSRLLRILDEDNWSDNNGNPYDNGAEKAYVDANGNFVQVSDQNKKDNIKRIDHPIEKIMQIGGYTYQFKLAPAEIEKGQKPVSNSGVLAQEVKEVLPEAVQQNESGEYFVNYAAIMPLLIEAIKTQQHTIDDLQARLKAIEDKLK